MDIYKELKLRRSYYRLDKQLPVGKDVVQQLIEEVTELVPDAFNMKSARVVVAFGSKQDELWDGIYETFGGKVPRDKIDGFKAAAGTVLYFYDEAVVENMQGKFPLYAENFPTWANHANGMLQISIWSALRKLPCSEAASGRDGPSIRASAKACRQRGEKQAVSAAG